MCLFASSRSQALGNSPVKAEVASVLSHTQFAEPADVSLGTRLSPAGRRTARAGLDAAGARQMNGRQPRPSSAC